MSIKSDINELESIRAELKSLNLKRKKLKEKEKEAELRIAEYLKSKDTPGVKNNGVAVVLEEKEQPGPKKNKDRDLDAIVVLERHGISDPKKVLEEIMTARKGEKTIKPKVKVSKYKL